MIASAGAVLRTIAFGDLDAGVWGTAWIPSDGGRGCAGVGALGPPSVRVTMNPALDGTADPRAEWHLADEQWRH